MLNGSNGSKWSRLDGPLREAVLSRMPAEAVLRKLLAGTLDGLDGPVEIPRSTFYRRWNLAKRAVADGPTRGRDPAAVKELEQDLRNAERALDSVERSGNAGAAEQYRDHLRCKLAYLRRFPEANATLDAIRVGFAVRDVGDDPERLAEATGLPPKQVRELVETAAKRKAARPLSSDSEDVA